MLILLLGRSLIMTFKLDLSHLFWLLEYKITMGFILENSFKLLSSNSDRFIAILNLSICINICIAKLISGCRSKILLHGDWITILSSLKKRICSTNAEFSCIIKGHQTGPLLIEMQQLQHDIKEVKSKFIPHKRLKLNDEMLATELQKIIKMMLYNPRTSDQSKSIYLNHINFSGTNEVSLFLYMQLCLWSTHIHCMHLVRYTLWLSHLCLKSSGFKIAMSAKVDICLL